MRALFLRDKKRISVIGKTAAIAHSREWAITAESRRIVR